VVLNKTIDSFLGGRIQIVQPSEGYRAGIDPIFLAASLHPKQSEKILDVGAGVGVAAIALAIRCPQANIIGLEIQPDLVNLANENIETNNLKGRVEMITGDLLFPPDILPHHSFDHVMTNPPYYEDHRTQTSPIPGKAQANTETVDVGEWIKSSLKFLKPKGLFTMIHRAERLSDILYHLENKVGDLVLFPLWPGEEKPARRFLIQGRKNRSGELRISKGLCLHGGAEKYTPEAEAILRHAEGLVL
jgi:FkbM family methyltransferase